MAYIATSKHEDALDIVQDAMYTLAKNYSEKPSEDWPALFHRIMQNKIRDWYRRGSVLKKLFFWQSHKSDTDNNEYVLDAEDEKLPQPDRLLESNELGNEIDKAIHELPLRQQQTFLLRNWEGLNVKQTAEIMQISEGSVKTHYSRALQALRESLKTFDTGKES